MTNLYIQYGCGLSCPEGWLNFDASPRLRLEQIPGVRRIFSISGKRLFPENVRFGDIVAGLPVPDKSASAVYCSHVLEHLHRSSIDAALRNTIKILRPGGLFRLVVPDLEWRARKFIEMAQQGDPSANDWFMHACHLGEQRRVSGIARRIQTTFGNSQHRWMWHQQSIEAALVEAGFVSIRRCEFGDSTDNMFSLVEDQNRFEDAGHRELAMEAICPE